MVVWVSDFALGDFILWGYPTVASGVLAGRLDRAGAGATVTGVCFVCEFRVPVLRSGVCAGHWPHGVGWAFAYLARLRPRCGGSARPARPARLIIVGGC